MRILRQHSISTTAHHTAASRLPLYCLLVSVFGLQAGCVEPAVSMKPPAFQDKAVTVRDWDRVAERIATRMQDQGLLVSDPKGQAPLFYVNLVANQSAFLLEVRLALEGELHARNIAVARSPSGATIINLDASYVQWGHPDRGPGGFGTVLGAATATGYVIANADREAHRAGPTLIGRAGIALGAGVLLDVLAATQQTTNTEVSWQATIVSGDRLLMLIHEPMYVTASDAPLYLSRTPGPMFAFESVQLRYRQ